MATEEAFPEEHAPDFDITQAGSSCQVSDDESIVFERLVLPPEMRFRSRSSNVYTCVCVCVQTHLCGLEIMGERFEGIYKGAKNRHFFPGQGSIGLTDDFSRGFPAVSLSLSLLEDFALFVRHG